MGIDIEKSFICIINRLEDAIAAEKSFETQLEGFSKEGDDAAVQNLFAQHARETKTQYEQLTIRLQALGGSTSTLKSFLAHIFNFAPKVAQLGHDESERLTQNLMMAYTVENAEVAMYESLATAARLAGDAKTERLARELQAEEKDDYDKSWNLLRPSALASFQTVVQRHASA